MVVDYNNSIVSLSNSILKYFGARNEHSSLKDIDKLLEHQYNNVVVLLLDGMGMDALEYHLEEDSFFRRNILREYSSVFPPTTTSSTTSMESGLTPMEHGWLGWSLYFSDIDKIVDAFINMEKDTEVPAADYHVAGRYIPYKSIYDKIKEAGQAGAYSVSHFGSNIIESFDELTDEIVRLCQTSERKYIYGYWEYPDSLMHTEGCYSPSVTNCIKEIQAKVEAMCDQLNDTLLIVTADHGHGDLTHYVLRDYPKLVSMLKRPTAIEPRATAFFVKEEYIKEFPKEFKKEFGADFLLYLRDEVIEKEIFGHGLIHPRFKEMVGDYLAVAIKDKGLVWSEESYQFASHHAGYTDREMRIPLITISKK
ncbi:MAG TPA: hypothetical protein GXZ21_10155 [Clostridiales bacterium]|nr:hypothetical protein [Clostridiales bacterium]